MIRSICLLCSHLSHFFIRVSENNILCELKFFYLGWWGTQQGVVTLSKLHGRSIGRRIARGSGAWVASEAGVERTLRRGLECHEKGGGGPGLDAGGAPLLDERYTFPLLI